MKIINGHIDNARIFMDEGDMIVNSTITNTIIDVRTDATVTGCHLYNSEINAPGGVRYGLYNPEVTA